MKIPLIVLVTILISCGEKKGSINNDKKIITAQNPGEAETISNPLSGCYIKILKRDTMVLHLQQNGTDLSGKMSFDNYEKDGSSGNVKGVVENDIIKLWYNFQSEGMNSVSELYFKVADSSLIQGFGPVANKADTSYFTDQSKIEYSSDQSFTKSDCSTVPGKYL